MSRQRGLASFGFTRELDEVGIGGGWRFARLFDTRWPMVLVVSTVTALAAIPARSR